MLLINIETPFGIEFLDAANFVIKQDGTYHILLMDGTSQTGMVADIQFLHIEQEGKD